MKRLFCILIGLLLLAAPLTGCAGGGTGPEEGSGKLSVVSTLFPQYDFARRIAGEKAEVTLLLPPGTESHTYEPTPSDIVGISKADLFLYTGAAPSAAARKSLSSCARSALRPAAFSSK